MFTKDEVNNIKRKYDFNERINNNSVSDSSIFTEHNLDSIENNESNCNKSSILGPYNTNEPQPEQSNKLPEKLIISKKVIKFKPKLREINREYERNNNSYLDNGIYIRFIESEKHIQPPIVAKTTETINKKIDRKSVV